MESIWRQSAATLLPVEAAACKAWLAWRASAEHGEQGGGPMAQRKYVMGTYFDLKWQSTAQRCEELAGMSACAIENKV